MSITSIEIKFSKVGVHSIDQPRKVNYIPVAVLQFDNLPKKKRIYLDGFLSDKKSVKQILASETFIALKIDAETTRNFETGILTNQPEIVEQAMNLFDDVWIGKMCKTCKRRMYCADPVG